MPTALCAKLITPEVRYMRLMPSDCRAYRPPAPRPMITNCISCDIANPASRHDSRRLPDAEARPMRAGPTPRSHRSLLSGSDLVVSGLDVEESQAGQRREF